MSLFCRCDQTIDACLAAADGPDDLCRECRDPDGRCGRRRAFQGRGDVVGSRPPRLFEDLALTVRLLRADFDG